MIAKLIPRSFRLIVGVSSLSLFVGWAQATEYPNPQVAIPMSAADAGRGVVPVAALPGDDVTFSDKALLGLARSDLPAGNRVAMVLSRLGSYTDQAQDVIRSGFAYLGVDYRRGGTSPETGFDCSGLVRRVFGDAFGVNLPHNARAISNEGAKVSVQNLRPGDLVFFNTLRKTFSHVGIYVGNNLFLHAPSSGGGVRLEDLRERYWVKHFNGARRIAIE